MSWYGKLLGKKEEVTPVPYGRTVPADYEASFNTWTPIYVVSFDGEKTPGEIGVIKSYRPDYARLRARSWQLYLENDISQGVIKKFVLWVCGGGLALQSEPFTRILKENGISIDYEEFTQAVETRFEMFAKSKRSSYSGEQNLNQLASEARRNSYIGGDCLVVQRVENGFNTVQLIDGAHIVSPSFDGAEMIAAQKRGNKIIDGVEISKKGEHIAFYVRGKEDTFDFQRIQAKDKSGRKMAYLVYGIKYRTDSVRGIPLITAVMESLKKLDRYKEATVGSAEERQKIAFSIEHDLGSTGENVFTKQIAATYNSNKAGSDIEYKNQLREAQGQIASTTQKSVFNMPNGSTLKSLESKNELYFKDFFDANIEIVCSCIGIPPEIAKSMYDSNFSASRAAIKDWEHTLMTERADFGFQFYDPIYELWFDLNVLKNKITAPGYKKALFEGDIEVTDAFINARWEGASVPHIDPLKEVKAEREKLGELGKHIPLTTVQKATKNVNGGESTANIEQFMREVKSIPAPISEPKNNNDKDNE